MNKIRQTSSDKVNGKLVRYREGDCISINVNNRYLGAIMTGKFNKYYNLTLMEFELPDRPKLSDFLNSRFFGTRFGSWEDLTYAVDQQMVTCKYVDNDDNFEKIGSIQLIQNVMPAGYSYLTDRTDIFDYFSTQLPIRIEKSNNAAKFPAIAFVGKHLIETEKIII
ncbi:hypothetical protein LVD15_16485 [Fulvivirga maritima]|uniref:hypothetical protein n=1 Tax=Fulvivirga maritima TaxID=2904247 RepID=UPI001F2287E7|nr:hypothetical protein [Fulvivirga maritima]UII24897.1 hypothetical protein LVD15_16485 [Fulvivirga maritima]